VTAGGRLDPRPIELQQIAAGQEAAFARFVARAEAAVRDHLRSFAPHADTEAILQEAFLRAWQVAPRVEADGRPDPLLRLTLRIARNLAVDEVRRARRLAPADLVALERAAGEAEVTPAPGPPDPLLRRLILACLALLPVQPRRALEARLAGAGGAPDALLAEGLGMRKNTFLQNFGRARRQLAACLRRKGVALEEAP
jgi:RNA polymerase sigma-70 factor (ECF subfamily)